MLEQRLTDTEIALSDALYAIRRIKDEYGILPPPSTIPRDNPRKYSNKTARMEAWKKFPLEAPQDIKRWWHELNENYDPAQGSYTPNFNHN